LKATIWTKENCPYCEAAKHYFAKTNIEYEEISLTQNNRNQLLELVPDAKTVPQIFIDNVLIGGYDDLVIHCENLKG
jgi:glutaredoxin